jgi:hypothetical protein
MTYKQREILESFGASGIVTFKLKDGSGHRRRVGAIDDHVFIVVQDYKHFIQRIRLFDPDENDGCDWAYRIGYYTWTAEGDSVKFGQFHPLLAETQIQRLFELARAREWPAFLR